MKITVINMYPELLNLYSDSGNILALKKRCHWRGIDIEIININGDEKPDFTIADIVFIGGGSDKDVIAVADKIRNFKNELMSYAESYGVILGICGGYQLLGNYFENGNERISALGLLDIYTVSCSERIVSNVILESEFGKITGFENHKGKTYTGSYKPLGKVIYGKGNNGEDGNEGVIEKNIFGTYLHGPLLPKNPRLCDELLKRALERKYNKEIIPDELDNSIEERAEEYILNRFLKG